MAADLMPEDELPAALLNARVQFWMCINRAHKNVVWDDDVAKCPDCGVTSEMTKRYAARVREQVAREIEANADPSPWGLQPSGTNNAWIDSRDCTKAAAIARGER